MILLHGGWYDHFEVGKTQPERSVRDPEEMREALGVGEGDELLVVLDDGRIVLTTPKEHARATRGSLKGTWGRSRREIDRQLERERRSWR